MERVLAGLQQRRVVTEKEKRILAYHEAGHALMAHLMGDLMPVQKVTIVGRGDALGYAYYLPMEDRYLHTKEELIDVMKVALAGRAAEQIVFGRVTNGAANDLEKVTEIARAMVFEYGMSEVAPSRTMRADNYALSEETKRLRDSEQARLTDDAYEEAQRLLLKHRAVARPGGAGAAREGDARARGAARRCSPTSSPSRARPRRSAPCVGAGSPAASDGRRCRRRPAAGGLRAARRASRRLASARRGVRARGIHHLGVAVDDLDEALATYERLFGAELEHRARVRGPGRRGRCRARRRRPCRAARAARRRHACRPVPREPRPGHAPRRLRGRRRRRRARRARGRRRAADRRGAAAGLFGLEVAFVHPDAVHGVLTEVVSRWLKSESVRIEIGFDGGQIMSALVTVEGAEELERALATRRHGRSRSTRTTAATRSSCGGSST